MPSAISEAIENGLGLVIRPLPEKLAYQRRSVSREKRLERS